MRRRLLTPRLLTVAGLVLLLAATAFVAIRTLLPSETVTLAKVSYDTLQPNRPTYGKQGAILSMPIVVDDRLRVYAHQREVWADAPVSWRWPSNPYWTLRRWPGEVVGVVAAPGPVVVSKWSDGVLVGTDARTGRTLWQAATAVARSDSSYRGRRTGSATVITPPDLYTAVVDGKTIVLSTGDSVVNGYDPATGARLWSHSLGADLGCRNDFTIPARFVSVNRCASTVDVVDVATGTSVTSTLPADVTPAGCAVGRSRCAGAVWSTGALFFGTGGTPIPSPALAVEGAMLAGNAVLTRDSDGHLVANDAATGTPLWTVDEPGTLLTTDDRYAYLLNAQDVTVISLASGERVHLLPGRPPDQDKWLPGVAYAADGTLFVERRKLTGKPTDPDAQYFYNAPTVELFGSAGGD